MPRVPTTAESDIHPTAARKGEIRRLWRRVCRIFLLCRNHGGLRRVTPLYSPFGESASIADGWSPAKPTPAAAARRAEALHPLLETEYDMKNKKLSIRISEQDLAAIHRKANTANLSITDYVTRSCLNKQIVVVDGLENIIREQKAIGKNLNRLTLLCNMGRVSVADLSEVKNEYARLNELLCSLLDRKRWQ